MAKTRVALNGDLDFLFISNPNLDLSQVRHRWCLQNIQICLNVFKHYLKQANLERNIEVYVKKINPPIRKYNL